jgi:hypothetical protein
VEIGTGLARNKKEALGSSFRSLTKTGGAMRANLLKLFAGTTYDQMVEAYLVEVKCCSDDPKAERDHAKIVDSMFSVGAVMFGDRWLQDSRVTVNLQK